MARVVLHTSDHRQVWCTVDQGADDMPSLPRVIQYTSTFIMDLDTLCVYKDVERGVTSRSLRERQEIANTVLRTREGIWLRGRTKLGLAILSNFGSNEDVNAMWLRVGLVCPATRVFIPDLSVITNTFSLHPEDIDILATF